MSSVSGHVVTHCELVFQSRMNGAPVTLLWTNVQQKTSVVKHGDIALLFPAYWIYLLLGHLLALDSQLLEDGHCLVFVFLFLK